MRNTSTGTCHHSGQRLGNLSSASASGDCEFAVVSRLPTSASLCGCVELQKVSNKICADGRVEMRQQQPSTALLCKEAMAAMGRFHPPWLTARGEWGRSGREFSQNWLAHACVVAVVGLPLHTHRRAGILSTRELEAGADELLKVHFHHIVSPADAVSKNMWSTIATMARVQGLIMCIRSLRGELALHQSVSS